MEADAYADLTLVEVREKAESVGPSLYSVIRAIQEDLEDSDVALRESLAILRLSDRFTDSQVEQACEYALGIVAKPRRAFLQTILEARSGL